MQDGTILIWDLWLQMWTPTGVANNKGGNDLDGLWADLADPDAGKAYRAICTLSAAPAQAIAFLADRLLRRTGCMNWEQVQSLVQMQIDY